MPLTTAGQEYLATKMFDGTGTLFDNTNSYIGVGTDNTAEAVGDTSLTNEVRKGMEASYPTLDGTPTVDLTFRSIYATGDANQAWAEWGIFNHASTGIMFSRKVEDLGTKTVAQTWQITVVVSILIG